MKFGVVLITAIVTTISLTVPVIAQINRPSQDFFEQGREQLEREIQILREESSQQQNPQKPRSEPVLEISPPNSETNANPSPQETPKPTPNQTNNSR